jgi:hypothetical protein
MAKAAIGESFTQVCAAKIASLGEKRIPTICATEK